MIQAYPLCWPAGKPRRPASARDRARFGKQDFNSSAIRPLTIAQGVSRVKAELERFTKTGHTYRVPKDSIVISSNVPISKVTGLPLSDTREPNDPGVAIYFKLDGRNYCMECDAWTRVADNLAAVAAHLSCLRGIERYEVGETQDAFRGYALLPYTTTVRPWYEVLEVKQDADWDQVKEAYDRLVKVHHPDTGGSDAAFQELGEAYAHAEKFLKELV